MMPGPRSKLGWLRALPRPELSSAQFCLLLSAILIAVYNVPFWSEVLRLEDPLTPRKLSFVVGLAIALVALLGMILTWITIRPVLKIFAATLLVGSSVATYFMNEYGIQIDWIVIRDVLETDRREVTELLSPRFLLFFLLLGVLPSVLLWRVRLRRRPVREELFSRAAVTVITISFVGLMSAVYYPELASLYRPHRYLRHLITPSNYVYGIAKHFKHSLRHANGEVKAIGEDARVVAEGAPRRRVVVLVVGETARAQEFSLNGYERPTNPRLASEPVVSFDQVASCGTSTATSVPCMFSRHGRAGFDVAAARSEEGLLDVLDHAGLRVVWRENNSGCKGACDRIEVQEAMSFGDPELCNDDFCFDEALLDGLPDLLREGERETLVVLHQQGSHGPAYDLRYPDEFRRFVPVCENGELASCDHQEIVNSYDNTILYTDHVLGSLIELLDGMSDEVDSAMIYVSDHGESLGEKRLYLHGMPYLFAPKEQTRVPLVVWLSEGWQSSSGIDTDCLEAHRSEPLSHDYLFHSVLGMFGVATDLYDPSLDLFATCSPDGPPRNADAGLLAESGASESDPPTSEG